jgi:hypothetical protein
MTEHWCLMTDWPLGVCRTYTHLRHLYGNEVVCPDVELSPEFRYPLPATHLPLPDATPASSDPRRRSDPRRAAHRSGKNRHCRHLGHQERGVAAIAGHGDRELAHRCVRRSPHRVTGREGRRRLDRKEAYRVGDGEREARDVGTVRPRMDERAHGRTGRVTEAVPHHRVRRGVDARNERRGQGGSRAREG